jgi:hypothetical protein
VFEQWEQYNADRNWEPDVWMNLDGALIVERSPL